MNLLDVILRNLINEIKVVYFLTFPNGNIIEIIETNKEATHLNLKQIKSKTNKEATHLNLKIKRPPDTLHLKWVAKFLL